MGSGGLWGIRESGTFGAVEPLGEWVPGTVWEWAVWAQRGRLR